MAVATTAPQSPSTRGWADSSGRQGSLGLARAAQCPGASQWLHSYTENPTLTSTSPLHSAVSFYAELICRCLLKLSTSPLFTSGTRATRSQVPTSVVTWGK